MNEWISIKDDLPGWPGAIVKIRRENGDEMKAYYHSDSMGWLRFYGMKTSQFESYENNKFLFDVTHWMSLEKSPIENDT